MLSLDQFISQLYHSAAVSTTHSFRERALRSLHEIIPFDAALWATGSFEKRTFHTTTLLGLPKSFAVKLIARSEINPIVERLHQRVGQPVDMSDIVEDDEFFSSKIYQECFEPFNITRILSSAHLQERSDIFTILTLYRFDKNSVFSQIEKDQQNRVLFHLLSAASQNYFLYLKEQHLLSPEHSAALCDKHGYIYQAEPTFIELLDNAYPDRKPNIIPITEIQNRSFELKTIGAKTTLLGDLFCVEIWPATLLDTLTARERQVVDSVGKGMTFKEIAKQLELAPSTISNHLYRVYDKLNISSRSELAALLN